MAKTLSAIEKLDGAYVEDASKTNDGGQQEEVVVREFDPKFMRKTMLKVRRPSLAGLALCADFRSWI